MPDNVRPWTANARQVEAYMNSGQSVNLGIQQTRAIVQTVSATMNKSVQSMQASVKISAKGITDTMQKVSVDMTKSMQSMTTTSDKNFKTMFRNLRADAEETNKIISTMFQNAAHKQTSSLDGSMSALRNKQSLLDKLLKKPSETFSSQEQMNAVLDYRKKMAAAVNGGSNDGGGRGGGGKNGNGIGAIGDGLKGLTGIAGELTSALTKVLPALTAIGGISAFVGSIAEEVFHLSSAFEMLQKSAGGGTDSTQKFQDALPTLQRSTRLGHDELIKLGEAFTDVGVPISSLNTNLVDYVATAGVAVRMFGVSDEVAAKYTRTLHDAGASFKEINGEFNSISEQMGQNNETIKDAADAMQEAASAWDEYGGAINSNIGEFRKGIMDTKGLFRVFNMDAKQTSAVLGSLFGDMHKQQMQAVMVSHGMGISQAKAYNMLTESPEQGTAMRMHSAMNMLSSNLGSDAGTMFMGQKQLNDYAGPGEEGERRKQQINMHQRMYMDQLGKMGLDPSLGNKAQEYVKNFGQQHPGMSPQDTISAAFKQAESDRTSGKSNSLISAMTEANKTPQEQMKQLGEEIKNQIVTISNWLTKEMWPEVQPAMNSISNHLGVISDTTISVLKTSGDMIHSIEATIDANKQNFKDLGELLMTPLSALADASAWLTNHFGGGVVNNNQAKTVAEAILHYRQVMSTQKQYAAPPSFMPPDKNGNTANTSGMLSPMMGAPISSFGSMQIPKEALGKLNAYRKSQGMPGRGLAPEFMKNSAMIMKIGQEQGLSEGGIQSMISMMVQESGGKSNAYGDPNSGGSWGPFQFNKPETNWHMTPAQAMDPETAIRARIPEVKRLMGPHLGKVKGKKGMQMFPGIMDPGKLSANVQRPAEPGKYADSVNTIMPFAAEVMRLLKEQNDLSSKALDVHKDQAQKSDSVMANSQLMNATNNPATNRLVSNRNGSQI